jgi:hypothetical protein
VWFLNRTDAKEQFLNAGLEVVASSPESFTATMKAELVKWGKVIKDTGIKVDQPRYGDSFFRLSAATPFVL